MALATSMPATAPISVDVRGPRFAAWVSTAVLVSAPRLGPILAREPLLPLIFAQLVGLAFAVVGVVGFAAGFPAVGLTATAFALVAAFLNAAFGICLGCRCHPLVARFRAHRSRASHPA